jgi:hypothetical protein
VIKEIITRMNSADMALLISDPDDFLKLDVEEQAKRLLKLLTSDMGTGATTSERVSKHNFFNRGNDYAAPPKYGNRQKGVDEALSTV